MDDIEHLPNPSASPDTTTEMERHQRQATPAPGKLTYIPQLANVRALVCAVLYGNEDEVRVGGRRLMRTARELGARYLGDEISEGDWAARHDRYATPLHGRTKAGQVIPMSWHCEDAALNWTQLPAVRREWHAIVARLRERSDVFDDWGMFAYTSGRMHVRQQAFANWDTLRIVDSRLGTSIGCTVTSRASSSRARTSSTPGARGLVTAITTADALDEAIAKRTNAAFDLLERLVAQPSEVGHEAGAIAELDRELAGLGFATSILPIPPATTDDPAAGVPQIPYGGDRGPLVARLPAKAETPGARSLLLNGHLDVVPPGDLDAWSGDPFAARVQDGWMIGRGAGDMKGVIAMAILATGALLDVTGDDLAGELTMVGAIEEECTGNGTLATVHADVLADATVLTEPTDLGLLSSGIGILWLELSVGGAGGHAETAGDAPSAIDVAAALLPVLRDLERRIAETVDADGAPRYRVNVGAIHSGEWTSSVPASARLSVRVGFPSAWSTAAAEAWVRAAVDELAGDRPDLAGHRIGVRFTGMRAEGYALAGSSELTRALQAAHVSVHGSTPAVIASAATTDARFYLNQAGRPAVCFGPRARGLHAADEAVELDSIVQGARTLSRFMASWLTAGETSP